MSSNLGHIFEGVESSLGGQSPLQDGSNQMSKIILTPPTVEILGRFFFAGEGGLRAAGVKLEC